MNKRKVGQKQEEIAAEYLKGQGYKILEQNFCCPLGEIDLIALHQGYLVFVEVKYRRTLREGYPQEAVTLAKQKKISKAALWYMTKNEIYSDMPCRFDVVAMMPNEIQVITDAFPYVKGRVRK